jgi:hypothetical protein
MLPMTLPVHHRDDVAPALKRADGAQVDYLQEEVRVLREAFATATRKSRISLYSRPFPPPGDQREGVDARRARGLLDVTHQSDG